MKKNSKNQSPQQFDKPQETNDQVGAEKILQEVEHQLKQAQETALRAQADYQNLLRRTREEKLRLFQIANADLVIALLEPLDHLQLAVKQLNDPGLKMVEGQFEKTLSDFGVEQINPLNKSVDAQLMEVVENLAKDKKDEDLKVVEVRKVGVKLNGQVIRHAKVVVG